MNTPQGQEADLTIPVYLGDATDGIEVSGADKSVHREAEEHGWRLLSVLSLLMGFAAISTDVYLPAMPTMSEKLGTNPGMIEWTITGYLIGFSLGQLLWGPISDRHGRRIPIAIGLIFFIIGSAGCAMAGNIWMMIIARLVQAIGACASVVLARAIVRDLYHGNRAAQIMSTLITVMAIAPLIGPFVGGQILLYAGWRWIFWLMVAVGIFTLGALFTIPETLALKNRSADKLTHSIARYWEILSRGGILSYIGVGAFFYGAVYAYIAGSPFAYISYHHLPPQYYGFLFATGIVGIMLSNTINSKILEKFGGIKLVLWGSAFTALSGLIVLIAGLTDFAGIWGFVVPLFFFVSMNGFIVANSIAGALENYPKHAGSVSALVGAMQYGTGIIGTGLVGFFADGTPRPMCVIIAVCGIGSLLCASLISKKSLK